MNSHILNGILNFADAPPEKLISPKILTCGGRIMDEVSAALACINIAEDVIPRIKQSDGPVIRMIEFIERARNDLGSRKPQNYPQCLFVEWLAILFIARWRRSAVLAELAGEFPPINEILAELLGRFWSKPESLCQALTPASAPLICRVLQIWIENCALSAPGELQADIMIQQHDHAELLDAFADLVWQHRGLAMHRKDENEN